MELVSEQKRKEFIRLENSKTPYTPSENIMDEAVFSRDAIKVTKAYADNAPLLRF